MDEDRELGSVDDETLEVALLPEGARVVVEHPGGGGTVLAVVVGGRWQTEDGAALQPGSWVEREGGRCRLASDDSRGADPAFDTIAIKRELPAPSVVLERGDEELGRWCLSWDEGQQLLVGRSRARVDVHVDDSAASRVHLRLFVREGRFYAEDLESRRGTLRNGRTIRGKVELRHGDVIGVASARLRVVHPLAAFDLGDSPEPDDAPPEPNDAIVEHPGADTPGPELQQPSRPRRALSALTLALALAGALWTTWRMLT